MNRFQTFLVSAVAVVAISPMSKAQTLVDDAKLSTAIKTVQKVELHGVGHSDAVEAMKILNSANASQITLLFEALDDSNQISANWIRSAIQKSIAAASEFPANALKTYFDDQSNSPKGRWLAWQLINEKDATFRDKTIASLAADASMPLREIGIAKLIDDAAGVGTEVEDMDDSAKAKKKSILVTALENARDVGQIQAIVKSLKPLGQDVNLRRHLGFVETWHVVSGFDNKDEAGFDVVYEPENHVASPDVSQTFTVGTEKVSWKKTSTEDETGIVDLNTVIAKDKGVIAYAVAEFECSSDREAEVRIGTANAHKIWVNGELAMANEIYHNSNPIDKFSAPVKLKKGSNQVVLKICQNEQKEPWAQDWCYQVRFCDSTGKAVK